MLVVSDHLLRSREHGEVIFSSKGNQNAHTVWPSWWLIIIVRLVVISRGNVYVGIILTLGRPRIHVG